MSLLLLPVPLLLIPAFFVLRDRARTIYGSLSKHAVQKEIILPYSPNELTTTDIITITLHLLLKYLPFYGTPKLIAKDGGFELPALSLYGQLIVTASDVALFRTAIKPHGSQSEATNPLLLVSLTTPLLLTTLTHPSSPLRPLGMVNTRNRFIFHNAALCSSESELIKASKTGQLKFTSSMGGAGRAGRRKKRGVEFDVTVSVLYHGKPILTQELSFLQFLSKRTKPLYKEADGGGAQLEGLQEEGILTTTDMTVPANAPRAYAASCKDYNPIHVSSLAAKVFGFPSAIAHGNGVVAMMVQDAIDCAPRIMDEKREAEKKGQDAGKEPQERLVDWLVPKTSEKVVKDTVMTVVFVKPVTPLPAEMRLTWLDGTGKDGAKRVEFMANIGSGTCVAGSVA